MPLAAVAVGLVALSGLERVVPVAHAANTNATWLNTGATDGNWNTTSNWVGGVAPGSTAAITGTNADTSVATFDTALGTFGTSGNPIVIDSLSQNISGITFNTNAGNYFIGSTGGNSLYLSSGGTIQILITLAATNAVETINAPLVIEGAGGTYSLTNNSANGTGAGAGTLNFGGAISGGNAGATVLTLSGSNTNANTISGAINTGTSTSVAVTKSGGGTWVLSGNSNYAGATTINAGTLKLGAAGSGANTPLGTIALGTSVTANGAALDLGGFTLATAEALSLAGNGISTNVGALTNSGGAATYSGVVTIAAASTTIGGTGDITLSSALAANANSFIKVGAGKLTLSVNSTRTGLTQIDAGTIRINSDQAFGTTAASITINSGTLEIGTTNTVGNGGGSITLNNGGTILDGLTGNARIDKTINVTNTGAPVVTFNSGTTASNVLTINGGGNTRLTGGNVNTKLQITGSGEVRVGETGQGRTASVTGDWYLQGGQFRVRADGSLGAAANDLYFQGGKLMIDAAFTLGGSRVLDFSNAAGGTVDTTGGTLTLGTAGQLTGTNKLTKAGTNQLIVSAANSGFSGEVNITGGSVRANDGTGINSGSLLTLNGGVFETGANLARTGGSSAGNMQITGGASGFSANGASAQVAFGTLGSPTPLTWGSAPFAPTTLILNASTAANTLEFKNAVNLGAAARTVQVDAAAANTATMSGNLTGAGGSLLKTGTGTLILSGANSYDAGTSVNAGALIYANTNAKPSSGTTTVAAATTLGLGVGGAGFFSSTDVGNLFANTMTNVSMNATSVAGVDTSAGDFNVSATLTGSRALTQLGANTLTLSGPNTYTGATTVNAGTLKAGVASVAGVNGAFGKNSAVTLANTAGVALDITGFDTQIGSLAGGGATGGNVTLGSNTLTVGSDNANTTYAGVISSSAGVTGVSLNKNGTGQLQLDRANTFTGKIVIDGGKLFATEANGSLADAKLGAVPASFQADSITIKNGGSLNLASGTDGRSLSANRGIYLDTGTQFINTGSGDFYMNPVISGPGGLSHINLSGGYRRLYLFGANTYTGDTFWDATGSNANYGGIDMQNSLALQNSAVSANSVASWLGVNAPGGVLQLGGLTGANRTSQNLFNNPNLTGLILNPTIATDTKTFTNVFGQGSSVMTLTKTGAGTQALNGANTYTGKTTIKAGVLSINTIKIVGGVVNSLGQPILANATIDIGDTTTGATLMYTGTGDTTDRVINLSGTTGGATLDQSGASGVLTFSNNFTATGVGAKTLTLQGSTGGSGVISGQIFNSSGGATSLTKTGSGAWTLNGASTFTGDTALNAGTLTIGNNLALQNSGLNYTAGTLAFSAGINTPTFGGLKGSTSLSLASNVTDLTLNPGVGVTHIYSGTLGSALGGMNLIKTGSGTQVLGAATYTGTTAVNVGKLYLNGSNTTSAISVAGSATLGGNGTASSATATVANTGIVDAGSGGLGTLSLGGLTFSNSATVNIANVGNYSSNAAVNVLNSNSLTVSGGSNSITLALTGPLPLSGTAHLIQYQGSVQGGGAGFGAFTLNTSGLSAGVRALFNLVNNPGYVDFSYNTDKPVWSGAGDGNWITSPNLTVTPTTNWVLLSNSGTQTNYIANDLPVFDDTASGAGPVTVNISAADVAPLEVAFSNSTRDYTLLGAFGIMDGSSPTTLTKSGGARVTIATNNSYTGGTTISGGTVQVGVGGTAGSLGSGPISNSGTLDFYRSDTVTVGVGITGSGSVVQDGSGILALNGPNSYGGTTTLNAGTLTLGHATALGAATGTLIINGGTLDSSVASLVLTNNNLQTWNADFHFLGTNSLNLGTGAVSLGSTAGARTVTVDANTLTVGGIISDGVATSLTKAGPGVLVLGDASNYSDGTVLNGGTLTVNDGATLGASTGVLAVNNPNTGPGTDVILNLNGSVTTGSLSSAVATPSGGTNTVAINIANSKTFTVNQSVDGSFGGVIAGGGNLVKGGAAMLTLSGANTYSGGTTLSQGVLSVNSIADAGSSDLGVTGAFTFSGGTLQYTGSTAITSNRFRISGGTVSFDITQNSGGITITNPSGVSAFGNATVIKKGAGAFTLGGNVYYTDSFGEIDLRVDAGTMVLASTVSDPAFTWVVTNVTDVKPGATLKLGNTVGRQVKPDGGSFAMSGGTFDLNGNDPASAGNNLFPQITGTGTITNNSATTTAVLSIYPSVNKTFDGNIVDGTKALGMRLYNVAIRYIGGNNTYPSIPAATWTLTGNNTYSGTTSVTVGTLKAGSTTALSPNSAYTVTSTLDLANYNNSIASLTGTGDVTLGTATLTFGDSTSPAAFSGTISGAGSLIKTGSGTFTISSTTNSYFGGLTINNGQVKMLGPGSKLGGNTVPVTLGGGVLDLATISQTVGPVSITAAAASGDTILSTGGTANLTGSSYAASNSSGNAFINGVNLLASGSAGLTKQGAGILTLKNSTNTYTGNTTVSGGTLALMHSLSSNIIANSPLISVGTGAYLDTTGLGFFGSGMVLANNQTLTGTGTVIGKLTVGPGSKISPGNSPGTMTENANQTWNGGSYDWEINDVDAGAGTDPGWDLLDIISGGQLVVGSGITINVTSLLPSNSPGDVADFSNFGDYTWKIAQAAGGVTGYTPGEITLNLGGFTNLNTGIWSVSVDTNNVYINYDGPANVLVPEPSTWALAVLGLIALGLCALRRRYLRA